MGAWERRICGRAVRRGGRRVLRCGWASRENVLRGAPLVRSLSRSCVEGERRSCRFRDPLKKGLAGLSPSPTRWRGCRRSRGRGVVELAAWRRCRQSRGGAGGCRLSRLKVGLPAKPSRLRPKVPGLEKVLRGRSVASPVAVVVGARGELAAGRTAVAGAFVAAEGWAIALEGWAVAAEARLAAEAGFAAKGWLAAESGPGAEGRALAFRSDAGLRS